MEPGSRTLAEAIAFMVVFIGVLWFYSFWYIAILLSLTGYLPPAPPEEHD